MAGPHDIPDPSTIVQGPQSSWKHVLDDGTLATTFDKWAWTEAAAIHNLDTNDTSPSSAKHAYGMLQRPERAGSTWRAGSKTAPSGAVWILQEPARNGWE